MLFPVCIIKVLFRSARVKKMGHSVICDNYQFSYTIKAVKPVIGITSDINDNFFRLRQEYVSAVEKTGGLPIIIPPTTWGQVLNQDSRPDPAHIADLIDGLLLSGGGDIHPEFYGEDISVPPECLNLAEKQRITFELALLRETIKREKPILAICLGMQLVNIAYGGSLYQDIGLQIDNALDHRGQHGIKIVQQSAISNQHSAYTVNSTHHQAVKRLGDGLEVFAMSEDGIIEGFYKKEYPFLYGVQWHPERSLKLQTAGAEAEAGSPKLTDNTHTNAAEKYGKLSIWLFETFIKTSAAVTEKAQIKAQK